MTGRSTYVGRSPLRRTLEKCAHRPRERYRKGRFIHGKKRMCMTRAVFLSWRGWRPSGNVRACTSAASPEKGAQPSGLRDRGQFRGRASGGGMRYHLCDSSRRTVRPRWRTTDGEFPWGCTRRVSPRRAWSSPRSMRVESLTILSTRPAAVFTVWVLRW